MFKAISSLNGLEVERIMIITGMGKSFTKFSYMTIFERSASVYS
jgi:hypothetical protein